MVKGKFGNEDIDVTVNRVRSHGINVSSNFIFGLPDDTLKSMEETLSLALDLNTEWANFYSAMAYPGSQLYGLAQQRGWPLPDDEGGPGWIGYSQHGYHTLPLPTEHVPAVEVLKFRDYAFERYFGSPDYHSMLARRFNPAAVDIIKDMLSIKLRRRHHDEPGYYEQLRGSAKAGRYAVT